MGDSQVVQVFCSSPRHWGDVVERGIPILLVVGIRIGGETADSAYKAVAIKDDVAVLAVAALAGRLLSLARWGWQPPVVIECVTSTGKMFCPERSEHGIA